MIFIRKQTNDIWGNRGVRMKRAMTDSAKAERAKQILNAAVELYKTSTFDKIKMIDIAKEAGVSKGTLFNYYSSKESIFMEILFLEYEKRFRSLAEHLQPYGKMSVNDFKAFILSELEPQLDTESVYMRLNAIKNTILEKNIDIELAVKDKVEMYEAGLQLGQAIADRFDLMTSEQVIEFFIAQNAIVLGFMQQASLPKALEDGMEQHQLRGFQIDFKAHVLTMMECYMDGYFAKLLKK